MLLDSSSLQLSHCAPCWHPKRLLLPLFLSEISLSCKKTRIACNSPSMSNFWGQGQLIWNAPFGVDGDIPTHAAGTWWLTAWVLPKQPLCGPVVPPISRDQGAACHHWQEIIALTAAADINGTAQASESFSGGQRQPGWPEWFCFRKTWQFQEINITDPIPCSLQLDMGPLGCSASLLHDWWRGRPPSRLPKLPPYVMSLSAA